MSDWLPNVFEAFDTAQALSLVRAVLIVVAGLLVAHLARSFVTRALKASLDAHRLMLARRGAYYLVLILFLVTALYELGFNLGVLLGAAGIATVAIGFASQTSMSNLISGLFLIAENPFQIGDLIQVGTTVGEVLSIDLLSVKLRKFDNTFVRMPNELLIKSEFMTLTKFQIRRLDLEIGVAYKEQIATVREVLFAVADRNPLSLEEPRPLFILQGFGESALRIQFSVWVLRENYLAVKNTIQEEIKQAFDEGGIEIPFPHRTLYAGTLTDPFPVRVVALDARDVGAIDKGNTQ